MIISCRKTLDFIFEILILFFFRPERSRTNRENPRTKIKVTNNIFTTGKLYDLFNFLQRKKNIAFRLLQLRNCIADFTDF